LVLSDLPDLTGVKYDPNSMDLLGDPVVEAQMLIASQYVEALKITLVDFIELLSSKASKGSFLLSCRDDNSYTVLIEDGVVKSVAEYSAEVSTRIHGFTALKNMVKALTSTLLECRLFRLVAEPRAGEATAQLSEEKTPAMMETGGTIETVEVTSATRTPVEAVEKPPIDMDKLRGFTKYLRNVVRETAELYGCVLVDELDVKVNTDRVVIRAKLRKKGIFGKCRSNDLKSVIERDLPLIKELYEINVDIVFEAMLTG